MKVVAKAGFSCKILRREGFKYFLGQLVERMFESKSLDGHDSFPDIKDGKRV